MRIERFPNEPKPRKRLTLREVTSSDLCGERVSMDRRSFLRIAAVAPMVAPLAAPAIAAASAGPGVMQLGATLSTIKMEFPSLAGSWHTYRTGDFYQWLGVREPTMAEQVAESADELVEHANSFGNFGALAENAITRLTNVVIHTVEKAAGIAADESVEQQMQADDIFENTDTEPVRT